MHEKFYGLLAPRAACHTHFRWRLGRHCVLRHTHIVENHFDTKVHIYAFIMLILYYANKINTYSWFAQGKANHCHKFTKLKFQDTKCKLGWPYWIWIRLLFWQLETSGEVMEVNKQLKFRSHKRMQVEFILNNIDVMTHNCLSSPRIKCFESEIINFGIYIYYCFLNFFHIFY